MTERGEVKRDKAKAQKNSGRGKYQKGDAIWNGFVVDYKETAKSVTVSKEMWSKVCTDTFKVSRSLNPVLKLIIGEDSKTRLAVIEWSLLEQLVEKWNE